jgi:hypothetical protein
MSDDEVLANIMRRIAADEFNEVWDDNGRLVVDATLSITADESAAIARLPRP